MAFWTYCCKRQQAYMWGGVGLQYPGGYQYDLLPPVEGANPPVGGIRGGQWVDNEGDWIAFGGNLAIRSDGTLWMFGRTVEYSIIHQFEGRPAGEHPIQIGTDTDWAFVNDHGYLLKQDGSLWSMGSGYGGRLGTGMLANTYDFLSATSSHPHSQNPGGKVFRAVISSPVERVELHSNRQFSMRPTLSLTSVVEGSGEVATEGQGAELIAEWSGRIHSISVTNGGSGYTSPPSVSPVPAGDDTGEGVVLTAKLAASTVSSFYVESQGEGYTFASAVDPVTGATASAVVEDGKIVSWSITSSGAASENRSPRLATITGDGAGAKATCVMSPASVSEVQIIENPHCWTALPAISFSGGGGSGAQAVVVRLTGSVSSVTVAAGGSGYTTSRYCKLSVVATPHPSDTYSQRDVIGIAFLAGGPVVRVDGLPPGSVFRNSTHAGALSASDGIVPPFSIPLFRYNHMPFNSIFGASPTAEIVGAGGKTVPVQLVLQSDFVVINSPGVGPVTQEFFSLYAVLSEPATGFGHGQPVLRVYLTLPPPQPVIRSEFPGTRWAVQVPWCEPIPPGTEVEYFSHIGLGTGLWGYDTGYSYCSEDFTVESPSGASVSYTVYDGTAFASAFTEGEYFSYDPSDPNMYLWLGNFNYWARNFSHSPPLITGPYAYADFPLSFRVPSAGEVAVGYCLRSTGVPTFFSDRPSDGAVPGAGNAVVVSYPELSSDGLEGFRTASIQSGGDMYKVEPDIYFCVSSRPYPVRIGTDTWKSVGDRVAVRSDGKAFWWGQQSNGLFTSPVPIGQGVRLKCEPGAVTPNALSFQRLIVGRPEYGNRQCAGPSYDGVLRVIQESPIYETSGGFFTQPTRYAAVDVNAHGIGLGYTSLPDISYIKYSDDDAGDIISCELVGPTEFDRVEGGHYLIDQEGNAWDVGIGQYLQYGLTTRELTGYRLTTSSSREDALFSATNLSQSISDVSTSERHWHYVAAFGLGASAISSVNVGYYLPAAAFRGLLVVSQEQDLSGEAEDPCGGGKVWLNSTTETQYGFVRVPPYSEMTEDVAVSQSVPALPDGRVNWRLVGVGVSLTPEFEPLPLCPEFCFMVFTKYSQPSPFRMFPASIGITQINELGFAVLADGGVGFFSGDTLFVDPYLSHITSVRGYGARSGSTGSIWNFNAIYDGLSTRPRNVGDLSLRLIDGGEGYTEPPVVVLGQRPDVASATARLDGKVVAGAIIRAGSGFNSPPTLTVSGGGGSGASLQSAIEGPVAAVDVTSGGSGYRCPPRPVFAFTGVPAEGECKVSGTIQAIEVVDGGSGFTSPPEIQIVGSGSGASASATISGYVDSIRVSSPGGGYSSPPSVAISGGGGSGAEAIAIMSRGSSGLRVSAVVVTKGGSGYSSPPTISLSGGGGSGASATAAINAAISSVTVNSGGAGYVAGVAAIAASGAAVLSPVVSFSVQSVDVTYGGEYQSPPAIEFIPRGHVDSIDVTSGGSGYTSPPLVGVVGPCGTGTTASAVIRGEVDSVVVLNGGTGYLNPPLVELVGGYSPASGRPATATASCSGGVVTGISVTDGGSGYFSAPSVRIVKVADAIIECEVDGQGAVTSATVLSGGYGYSSPPAVRVLGGDGAELVATVANGSVQSVIVAAGGAGYPRRPSVLVDSGVGSGCAASATIDASVESVAVTSPGGGYEPGEPVEVFFSGGGGDGAAATAQVGYAGGGAAATSKIDGSIVAVRVTSEGGYYGHSPSVSVDMSGNWRAAQDPDNAGDYAPYIQTRIKGEVDLVTITSGGDNYSYGETDLSLGAFGVWKKPDWAAVASADEMGGPITSVNLNAMQLGKRLATPVISFGNNHLAECEISCLTGEYSVTSGGVQWAEPMSNYWYGGARRNCRYWPGYWSGRNLRMVGSIETGSYSVPLIKYSTPPSIRIVDSAGEGASAQLLATGHSSWNSDNVTITSGGVGYTFGNCFRLDGGVPQSWVTRATASLQFSPAAGGVSSISITNPGEGLEEPLPWLRPQLAAVIYLDGGGGDEGSLLPAARVYVGPDGTQSSLYVVEDASLADRRFRYPPRAVVVPLQKPAHLGLTNYYLINENDFRRLVNSAPEAAKTLGQAPTATTINSLSESYVDRWSLPEEWMVFPHYWDGKVTSVYLTQFSSGGVNYPPPSVSLVGGGGSGAQCVSEFVAWADVYSGIAARRLYPE